jgi:hypothetical protein
VRVTLNEEEPRFRLALSKCMHFSVKYVQLWHVFIVEKLINLVIQMRFSTLDELEWGCEVTAFTGDCSSVMLSCCCKSNLTCFCLFSHSAILMDWHYSRKLECKFRHTKVAAVFRQHAVELTT